MTFHSAAEVSHLCAIEMVERAASLLKLRDQFGPVEGIAALGAVAKECGPAWDDLMHAFQCGKIRPFEYARQACDMIYELRRRKDRAKETQGV